MTLSAKQYQMGEVEFRASPGSANPWAEVELKAVFTGPDNQRLKLAGFYDGLDRWAVRFCLPIQGVWKYRTECRLPELDGREGVIEVTEPLDGNLPSRHGGILNVDSEHHCLTYTDGTPFFWLGDTWWFCPSDHIPLESSNRPDIPSMYRHMLEVRRQQGFTVLHMAFLRTIRGTEALAFANTLKSPDFDVSYWQTADRYIALANEAGLIPAIAIGWSVNFANHSLEELRQVWQYVMARYGSFNVTWLICGEYNVVKEGESSAEPMEKALALGRYIKDIDPYRRAMTVHPWFYVGDKHQAWTESWCDFIMIQGGHWGDGNTPPASVYREAYNSGKPCLEGESNYEAIHAGHPVTPAGVRLVAYHSIQHGGFGFTYGSHGLWYPNVDESDNTFSEWGKTRPWWVALKDSGADQMGYMRKLYESLPWWNLQPWPDAILVAPKDPALGLPCAKGCRSPLTAVVYFPPGFPPDEPVRLRLTEPMSVALKGAWFDPRTGKTSAVSLNMPESGVDLLLPPRPTNDDWALTIHERDTK